jgi:hypothetical protein
MPRVSPVLSVLLAGSLACGDGRFSEAAPTQPASLAGAGNAEQQPSGGPALGGSALGGSALGGSGSDGPASTAPPDAAAGSDDGVSAPPGVNTSGAGGADSAPAPAFCDAPAKILVPSCGIGACHENAGADMSAFAVDTTSAYDFVDKTSTRHPECGRIIDSRDYSQSLLLLKIRGAIKDPVLCGGIMPVPSFPPLSANQIDCVASWLQQFQR